MSEKPETVTKLEITDAMGKVFKTALTPDWKPVSVAYVDDAGRPQISYRGTTQRLNSKQLAMWVRDPEGGIVKAMASRPTIALLYGDFSDMANRVYLNIIGRGHIDSDEATRKIVYDNSPDLERNQDPERKGVAIVIDVDQVDGLMGGKYLRMRPE